MRPGDAAVGAPEQTGGLDAGVDRAVRTGREAPRGRDGLAVVAVGQADRRVGPGRAEVRAAEDGRAVPRAAAGREERARRRVDDDVVDRPAFAHRSPQRPRRASRIALQDERALGGSDEQQGPGGHGCGPPVRPARIRRRVAQGYRDRRGPGDPGSDPDRLEAGVSPPILGHPAITFNTEGSSTPVTSSRRVARVSVAIRRARRRARPRAGRRHASVVRRRPDRAVAGGRRRQRRRCVDRLGLEVVTLRAAWLSETADERLYDAILVGGEVPRRCDVVRAGCAAGATGAGERERRAHGAIAGGRARAVRRRRTRRGTAQAGSRR